MALNAARYMLWWVLLVTGLAVLVGLYLSVGNDFSGVPTHHYSNRTRVFVVQPQKSCSEIYNYDPFSHMLATRWAQYKKFWHDNPDFKPKPSKHHNFYATKNLTIENLGHDPGAGVDSITHRVKTRETDGFFILHVLEFSNGTLSKGGSSFYSVVRTGGDMLHMCGYEDFFNGTYLIQCAMYSQCAHVTVNLVHANFKQHEGVAKRLDVEVFSAEACLQDACHQQTPTEFWREVDGRNDPIWHAADHDYPLPGREFCSLVYNMTRDRFYMIGSSHMEHQHWYIRVKCTKYIADIRKRLHYIPARFGEDVMSAINSFLGRDYAGRNSTGKCKLSAPDKPYNAMQFGTETKSKDEQFKDLMVFTAKTPCSHNTSLNTGLLFQIGSWDLSYHGLKAPLQELLPKLNKTLNRLAAFQEANPSVILAAMSPPPFYSYRYAETRNNDMIQIFNSALKDATQKHGIKYIDNFHVMYPLYDHTPPKDSHYIHCTAKTKCKHGGVGLVAIQRAVRELAMIAESLST